MKFTSPLLHKTALALALPVAVFSVASNCFGYGYQITITEQNPTDLVISDNDPNNIWSTTFLSASPGDVWAGILPAKKVVLPVGTFFTAEPGEANEVNEVFFLANDGLQVYSDVSGALAGTNTIIGNNGVGGAFPTGQDNNGNFVSLVFNDIPGHNAQGQDVPDATSVGLLLGFSALLTVFAARRPERAGFRPRV